MNPIEVFDRYLNAMRNKVQHLSKEEKIMYSDSVNSLFHDAQNYASEQCIKKIELKRLLCYRCKNIDKCGQRERALR